MTTPFTYSVKHIPSGKMYYGVRYADGCNPADLGTTYFTSSSVINQLLENEGKEVFEFKVRREFKTKQEAVSWESKFLTRVNAAESDIWFNKHNGDGKIINKGGYSLSEQTRKNQRKPKSPEHRQKLADHLKKVRKIQKWTDERRLAQSKKMKGNTIAKGHSRVVSEEEKKDKRERMLGNTFSKLPRVLKERECPHCGKKGKGGNMSRYHFDNCKLL